MINKLINVLGICALLAVLGFVGFIGYRIDVVSDICYSRNVNERQELIEIHERCMVEENCIYENRDIRYYDARRETQEACKLED